MIEALECVVTFGPGMQVEYGHNKDGSISILINPVLGTDQLELVTEDLDSTSATRNPDHSHPSTTTNSERARRD